MPTLEAAKAAYSRSQAETHDFFTQALDGFGIHEYTHYNNGRRKWCAKHALHGDEHEHVYGTHDEHDDGHGYAQGVRRVTIWIERAVTTAYGERLTGW